MLRFTAEIIPFGMESCKRTIGTIEVANIGGNDSIGKYKYKIHTDSLSDDSTGIIKKFDRNRGAIELLYEVLTKELKGKIK